jgi:membrane glycosyltransferase
LVLLDYFSVGVEHVAGVEVAFNSQTAAEELPGFAVLMVPAFVTSLLAIPVATLALWRAGLVAWWLPVVAAATFLAPNFVPGWLIGFSLMAAGMLTVAWALWRIPEDVWHPRSDSDPVSAADQRAPLPTG